MFRRRPSAGEITALVIVLLCVLAYVVTFGLNALPDDVRRSGSF